MKVEVRQDHIQAGKARVCSKCPVALALNEATGGRWEAGDVFALEVGPFPTSIKLPPSAIQFIEAFDEEQPVQPFTFEIDTE